MSKQEAQEAFYKAVDKCGMLLSFEEHAIITAAASVWATESFNDGIDAGRKIQGHKPTPTPLQSAQSKVESGDCSFESMGNYVKELNKVLYPNPAS